MKKYGTFFLALLIFFAGNIEAVQKKKKRIVQTPETISAPKVAANYGKYGFTLKTLDGKTLSLSEYAGKVVLVSIWAPWCGPCRLETPGFVNMYGQYKDKGFAIVGVAVQTNETDVRAFVQQQKVTWPVGINDDIAGKYATYGIPDNFLFKRDGTLIKHFIGYTREETIKPLIEQALKEIPTDNLKSTSTN